MTNIRARTRQYKFHHLTYLKEARFTHQLCTLHKTNFRPDLRFDRTLAKQSGLFRYRISSINSRVGYFLQAFLLAARYSRAQVERGHAHFLLINLSMCNTKLNSCLYWSPDNMKSLAPYQTWVVNSNCKSQLNGRYICWRKS